MLIHLIAAARPNFMKIAPLYHALKREAWAEPVIVHTGQHYDLNMSDAFFRDLNLPEPRIHLGVGSGTHAEQTGKVMMAYEKALMETQPDLVIVVGDVNSTMACTLAATKVVYPLAPRGLQSAFREPQGPEPRLRAVGGRQVTSDESPESRIQHPGSKCCSQLSALSSALGHRPIVAHLEAGLRSFDRTMPEEINRIVTDSLADILWTPSPDADENLLKEGVPREKIRRVGNIMIDSLEMLRGTIEKQTTCKDLNLNPGKYAVITLHRPSNVDDPPVLSNLCQKLIRISRELPLVFPVHPRTRKNLEQNGMMDTLNREAEIHLTDPLSYIPFMNLVFNCRMAITDSGGLQEETTYLGIPCLTMRPNTERPITVTDGTNQLCTIEDVESKVKAALSDTHAKSRAPEYWDGRTALRVIASIKRVLVVENIKPEIET